MPSWLWCPTSATHPTWKSRSAVGDGPAAPTGDGAPGLGAAASACRARPGRLPRATRWRRTGRSCRADHRRGDRRCSRRRAARPSAKDAELLLDLLDLRRRSGQPDDRRVEQAQIGFNLGRRVALRIDADEHDRQRIVALAKLPPQPGQPRQGRRADVRAMGEAEEDRRRLAVELGAGEWLARRCRSG